MKEIVDLTFEMENGMTTFDASWHIPFSVKQLGSINVEGRETRMVTMGTHAGTHIDSPLHFVENGSSIDKIPLDKLMGEVAIVDFSFLDKGKAITREMLIEVPISSKMIFKFGWGRFWKTDEYYKRYPFFSAEAAEYLLSKKIELLAMDTPSPDDSGIKLENEILGGDKDSPIHKMFLRNGVILIEYLANLEKVIDYDGWSIVAMPLKIKGADGAPARVCIYR